MTPGIIDNLSSFSEDGILSPFSYWLTAEKTASVVISTGGFNTVGYHFLLSCRPLSSLGRRTYTFLRCFGQ